jgi:hypothetical protein
MRLPLAFVCVFAAACSRGEGLGIAAVQVDRTHHRSSAVAIDESGGELGRVELVHGVFTLSAPFSDDYDTPEVDGRKLDVSFGDDRLVWETAGYEPTLQLPAHPAGHEALGAFLRDPRVQPLLDAWQIGFASPEPGVASGSYTAGSEPGTFLEDCSGKARCGPAVRGIVPNTCNKTTPATSAIAIARPAPYQEELIAQCCPDASAFPAFAIKACPTASRSSSCGDTGPSAACHACPGYPKDASTFCHVGFHSTLDFCFSSSAGAPPTAIAQLAVPELWPPDHRQVIIDLATCMEEVKDVCNPSLTAAQIAADPKFHIDSVGADEPIAEGDIEVAGPHSVALLVTRSGQGRAGRTYSVVSSYTNEVGATTTFECRFAVPHDMRGGLSAVE